MKNNVTIIETKAFDGCGELKKVTFSKKIKKFGSYAFANTMVERITLGKDLKEISSTVFQGDSNIKKITVDKKNPYMTAHDNAIYSKDGKTLINGMGVNKTITIPDKVTKIKSGAFAGNMDLDGIIIGKGVKALPSNCFADSGLEYIKLPKGLKTIGRNCFKNCQAFWKIKIPDSVTKIQSGAFYGCALEQLTIPKSVKTIETDALHCAVKKLIFEGTTPPKIKKQSEITYDEIRGDEDGELKNDYRGLDLCVDKLIVPKRAMGSYRKVLKKKLEYNTIKGN